MKIIEWDTIGTDTPQMNIPSAITIGVFDGVHIGHQQLIKNIVSDPEMMPMVITFRNNPARILSPETYTGDILTIDQKLERMKNLGVETAVLIDFSAEFSKITAKTFFKSLVEAFNIKKFVVGKYFNFGRHREGGVNTLKTLADTYNYCLTLVPPVFFQEERVSSTRVRAAIAEGRLFEAEKMLGEHFILNFEGTTPQKQTKDLIVYSRDQLLQVTPSHGMYKGTVTRGNDLYKANIEINDNELRIQNQHRLDHKEIQSLIFKNE